MLVLRNIRIGAKLGIGFGIALLSLCLIGALALLQVSRVYRSTDDLATNWLPSVQALSEVRAATNAVRRGSMGALLATNAQEKAAQKKKRSDALISLDAVLTKYQNGLISSAEEKQIFDEFKTSWSSYLASDEKINALSEAGEEHFAEARELASNGSSHLFAAAAQLIERDIALNRKGADAAAEAAASDYHRTLVLTAVLIVVAVALSVFAAVLITRSIVSPIRRSLEVAETVARGDLTSVIVDKGKDETGQLLRALGHMNERLADVVGRVRNGSESIATASAEIAAGNTDLSQRTEEQAASLEETAASMEELTATVKQNTESALQGNSLAANASEVAARGGAVVGRVVDTMKDISTSSAKVTEIISVIEGIAFQTNILALNAAVEAARAGEEGRGFAVVAGEVRTLAQRSATAAKEIKDLIDESVQKVNVGSELVEEAGQTMQEVVQSVKRVADLMGEISAASSEQHTGIEQVNVAVSQMDEVTQQNAALVEQASAAAQSMAQQSSSLREVVSIFRLSGVHREAPGFASERVRATSSKKAAGPGRAQATRKPLASSPRTTALTIPAVAGAAARDWQAF
ncbi:methyl-accepting chemotaxis sensory transducer [Caballeronia pedi]|uniref:Methyl-accepting chemotaxis sensory transducer n=1 Tax=Caballeronia pedi TaxID=1777141 RepID=A0A158D504_9BURK|nr:methyl-accepting chemotaxis protein [Caballeronia pedi]SAK88897.1 methyl-accepting chemotaxis sensory transducer [Caballeronia pedi]